jgi:putative NADPH-quinone reductase
MKKLLALNGGTRKNGNTSILLQHFLDGARENNADTEEIIIKDINLHYCRGCLRCNLIGRCSLDDDDWQEISTKILDADIIAFASPVYFHHVTSLLKKLIDRFRSFVNVQITEKGLIHTPWAKWSKDFVVIMCMGSSDSSDARPAIELFEFIKSVLGADNRLHVITATRLAVINQVLKSVEELGSLYKKINLPAHLAQEDFVKNKNILKQCYELGKTLTQ